MSFRAYLALLIAPVLLLGCYTSPAPGIISLAQPHHAAQRPLVVPRQELAPDDDYRLGPGDVLTISVHEYQHPNETTTIHIEVSSRGRIQLPLIDEVVAKGKTESDLKSHIAQLLGERWLINPQVLVSIKEYRSRKITIVGAVEKPGTHSFPKNRISVIEALSLAGGLTPKAGRRALIVKPPTNKKDANSTVEIDLDQLLNQGDAATNLMIESGSVIHVPRADRVYVLGYVGKPGVYHLERQMTALEIVAMAGGPLPKLASSSEAFIRRVRSGGKLEIISLDIDSIIKGSSPDIVVKPGDIILIPQTGWRTLGLEILGIFKGQWAPLGLSPAGAATGGIR